MTSKNKLLKIAKTMYRQSLIDGTVSPKKVDAAVKSIIKLKPANLSKLLKTYKGLIETKLSSEELKVEIPQKTTTSKQFEKYLISKTGAKRVYYVINPKLLAGAKITHGDWVFDQTLDTKLEQLTINN